MGYVELATRPLYVLIFLIPFMVLYELGSWYYLRHTGSGVQESIAAYGVFAQFFRAFGAVSIHIPPIALITILCTWHVLERDPLKVKASTLFGMAAESVFWTFPLLVFGLLIQPKPLMAVGPSDLAALSWQAKLTLAAGAGVYEELLFRFVLIAAVYFIVVDLFHGTRGVGLTIGAFASAIAFALFHNVDHPSGGVHLRLLLYYAVAGLYFAALFIFRGLGIAVAAHFLYDAVVLLAVSADPRAG